MENICDYKICTGCGLCVSECPKRCISLVRRGSLGHLFTKIDSLICNDCGLCKKNCPAICGTKYNTIRTAYAAWSKDDEEYRNSASGGAVSVFSEYVVSKGGIVYGCAMLPDINVKHIRVDNLKDVTKLKGSKYVQSSIVEVIPQLKDDVKFGRTTLFIGTPCQVAAIKSLYKVLLNSIYNDLDESQL